jgi:hypothetical protein
LNQNDVFDTVMEGLSAEANGADLDDFLPTHRWQFSVQVRNELAHIWREGSLRLSPLTRLLGRKQAEHPMLLKVITPPT